MVHVGALITVIGMIVIIVAMAAYYSSSGVKYDEATGQTYTETKIPDSYFLDENCSPSLGNAEGEPTYWKCPSSADPFGNYYQDHPELKSLSEFKAEQEDAKVMAGYEAEGCVRTNNTEEIRFSCPVE